MKYLFLIFLVACGKGGSSGSSQDVSSQVVSGSSYAIPTVLQPYSYGYELNYSCDGEACSVNGEIVRRYSAINTMAYTRFSGELNKTSTGYEGFITGSDDSNFTESYQIKINQNMVVSVVKMSGKCTFTYEVSNETQYLNYKGQFASNNIAEVPMNTSLWQSGAVCDTY
jgi:hypothetical protein